jgi:hypothetical protein
VMRCRKEYEKREGESFAVEFSLVVLHGSRSDTSSAMRPCSGKGSWPTGYRTEIWTTKRIADVIGREWRVRYHSDHIGRLISKLGWTHQKPARRAAGRNEEAIWKWVSEEWPQVYKTPRGWAPISNSSTNLVPPDPHGEQDVAPRGMTPVCRHPFQRKKVSLFGGHRQSSDKTGGTLLPPSGKPSSDALKWPRSLSICCATCADTSSSSGTTPGSIAEKR